MRLLTGKEMAGVDHVAINDYNIPGILLMENAGAAAARYIRRHLPPEGGRVSIFCGSGNNGGDGFVIARHLHNTGSAVRIFLLGDQARLKGDALINWQLTRTLNIEYYPLAGEADLRFLKLSLLNCDLLVDAVFGTGFHGQISGVAARAVELVNASPLYTVAIDAPSGLCCDDGSVSDITVKADATVTFAWPKIGLLVPPGCDYAGEVIVEDISIPKEIVEGLAPKKELLSAEFCRKWLPRRNLDAHKGEYGHVLVIGGSADMWGAPVLSAGGALRSGAGLVTVAGPAAMAGALTSCLPEAMRSPQEEAPAHLRGRTVAAGMGLGRDEQAAMLLKEVLANLEKPAVLDADALYYLAKQGPPEEDWPAPLILTPHAGEAARLLGCSRSMVNAARIEKALLLAKQYRATVVLKGRKTLIATPEGQLYVNPTGNAGMATGGCGDVLAGVIAAMLAAGLPVPVAAAAGVYVHGLAGDLAAHDLGERGLMAGDVVKYLPAALLKLCGN